MDKHRARVARLKSSSVNACITPGEIAQYKARLFAPSVEIVYYVADNVCKVIVIKNQSFFVFEYFQKYVSLRMFYDFIKIKRII